MAYAYSARRLIPRLSVNLHWEVLLCLDDYGGALGQPLPGRSQSRPDLTHVEAVLQPDNLDQSVSDVCKIR